MFVSLSLYQLPKHCARVLRSNKHTVSFVGGRKCPRSHNRIFLVIKMHNVPLPYTLLSLPLSPALNCRSLLAGGVKLQVYSSKWMWYSMDGSSSYSK